MEVSQQADTKLILIYHWVNSKHVVISSGPDQSENT